MRLAVAFVAVALVVGACSRPAVDASVGPSPSDPSPSVLVSTAPTPSSSPSPSVTPSPQRSSPSPSASALPTVPPEVAAIRDLLPTEIGGVHYDVGGGTMDVRDDKAGSDFCLVWCPGQLAGYGRALGVTEGPMTIVIALPDQAATQPVVQIWSIRVPDADGRDLVDAWVHNDWYNPTDPLPIREPVTIAGKRANVVVFDWPDHHYYRHYAYASGGILFLVFTAVGDSNEGLVGELLTPSDVVVEAFSKLP